MQFANEFSFKVSGPLALFSDPITRVGGEKHTYPIPTYSALVGITKAIYYKPTILIVIDSVKVLEPIQTCSKGIRTMKYNDQNRNDLSMYTYLTNVSYAVKAHFEWNMNHPELEDDRNEMKHYKIMERMIKLGGRRAVQLGASECPAYVEPCNFEKEKGYYDNSDAEISFGLMFHSFIYPDEAILEEDKGKLMVCFHTPVMKNGQIDFIRPEECTIKRHIRDGKIKEFGNDKISSVDELAKEVMINELD